MSTFKNILDYYIVIQLLYTSLHFWVPTGVIVVAKYIKKHSCLQLPYSML